MDETYKLIQSPFNREERLLMTNDPRACALATAIGGRESRRGEIFLTPGRAEKWRLLFDAGFTPVLRKSSWRFRRNGCSMGCLSEAVAAAKALQQKAEEVPV